jgi:FixJ family two-component response regulator
VTRASLDPAPDRRPLVVVVDDEPELRRIMVVALQEHFRVLVAASGSETLDLFAVVGRDISAVVTDVRMPGMDGVALAAAIRDRGVTVPILFVSGFGIGGEAPPPFLQKPFLPSDLVGAVQRLLGVPRRRAGSSRRGAATRTARLTCTFAPPVVLSLLARPLGSRSHMSFPEPGPRASEARSRAARPEDEVLRHLEALQHRLEGLMRENQAVLDRLAERRKDGEG